MSNYQDKLDFAKMLANMNNTIAHGRPVYEDSAEERVSFFTVDDEENLSAATSTGIHFPCMAMKELSGKLLDLDGSIRRNWFNEWYFLAKKDSSKNEQAAKNECYNTCWAVMNEVISWMYNEYEEKGSCGPFASINLNEFSYNMIGEVGDGLYGWKLMYNDRTKATEITNFDVSKWEVQP